MKTLLTFFLTLSIASSAFADVDTLRYTVMGPKQIAGRQLMWIEGPGHVAYKYEYNDRGRGPKLRVDVVMEDGQVKKRTATGVDYYKGEVNETFEVAGTTARWKNKIEEGSANSDGHVLYSPLDAAPGEVEWMLKLLLRQKPAHELSLLPSGKLVAEHVHNHTALVNGFREELELFAFSGSGGPPVYVWFTPKKEFFAEVGWFSTIKLGYEFLIPELKKIQNTVTKDFYEGQAIKLTQTATTPIAITEVNVFDSKKGKIVTDQTVIIDQGIIKAVGKSKSVTVPANAKTISGAGKMLLPGLWDNHTHIGKGQGVYHLAAGVTNVKDLANTLDLADTKKQIEEDDLLGPDISVWSGIIDFAGPFAGPGEKNVQTLEEGIAAVNFYADNGYQQIKLYSSIPPDWVKPLAAEAHKRGLKVVGHVPSGMSATRAINNGYDQIIHMNMIMLNFLGDSIDTRSMGRFIKVGERAKNIDLNSPATKQFIKLLQEKKIVVDPTMAIFEQMFINQPGKLAAGYQSIQSMFPPEIKRGLYTGGLPAMKGHEVQYQQSFDKMMKMLGLLYTNKITFVPGTDDFPGFMLHHELELYARAGVPNAEVLRKATLTSAQVAGKDAELGSIEVGKKSNLILVDGDPVKNISDIRKVELTFKGKNMYDAKALYASYGFGFWK
ncbi:MAG TPA: amidohydrolase family protein [Cyclobacteriaceae bacterium]|nr:amidohydrolase family protein [Cyclobacteriaceae bacterium]